MTVFTAYRYDHVIAEAWAGTWRLSATPDFRVNLYTSFTFNGTHTTKSAAETGATQVATGAGYTQNAKTLDAVTFAPYNTTGIAFKSNPVLWYPPSGTTLTARHALIYANGTTGAKPFLYIDFGQSISALSPQPLIIASPDSGWFRQAWST
jgi:hypothetical protein